MSRKTYNKHDDEYQYISVGWLGTDVPREGETSRMVMHLLKECRKENRIPDQWLGLHTCEICRGHHEKGEFYIQSGMVRFVLPTMVPHYIEEHGYKLPDEVEFVLLSMSKSAEACVELREIFERWEKAWKENQ
jgi:hypothetical protein